MKFKSILLGIILICGCTNRRYTAAKSKYKENNYASAVELYDIYIPEAKNGAIATIAELERSDAYFNLGLKAMKKENWNLAIRMFFLSNSNKADEIADDCYFYLAKIATNERKYQEALELYDIIETQFQNSNLCDKVLFEQIKLCYYHTKNNQKAFEHFQLLVKKTPDSFLIQDAEKIVDKFFWDYVLDAQALEENISRNHAIERLKTLEALPSRYKNDIRKIIADLYLKEAEFSISQEQYLEADSFFKDAINYNPNFDAKIQSRLRGICDKFIEKGDELLAQRNIDDAIIHYQKTSEIIPNYEKALMNIEKANLLKNKISEGEKLYQEGLVYEKEKQYIKAKNLFIKANKVDPLQEYRDKIFLITNLLEIKKDPIAFAKSIIRNYKNGAVITNLNSLENELISKYSISQVKTPGWTVLLSTGADKYEVRYDITTPNETYFFVWQVALRNRKVIPLNNVTETHFGK